MTDWNEIRKRYICGGISMRKLAEQEGVSFYTLRHRAADERWTALRDKAGHMAVTDMVDNVAEEQAALNERFRQAAELILDKLITAIQSIDEAIDCTSLRQFCAAMKDIKAVLDLRSELDIQEQEARIQKLQAETKVRQMEAEQDGPQTIEVILAPELEEWAG